MAVRKVFRIGGLADGPADFTTCLPTGHRKATGTALTAPKIEVPGNPIMEEGRQMQTETAPQEVPRSVRCCPECGSFFDEPRIHPVSGDLARKCVACLDWYPVVAGSWDGSE